MNLNNVGEMVERNLNLFTPNMSLLICGMVEDELPLLLQPLVAKMCVVSADYSYYRRQKAPLGDALSFNHLIQSTEPFDAVLLLLPKAKAEAQFWLAQAAPHLKEGGLILIAGDNRGGITAAPSLLAPYSDFAQKLDSARRASLYLGERQAKVATFDINHWLGNYHYRVGEHQLEVVALPGVFSAAELDLGSKMLLQALPKLSGRVLDFGCGAGVIGAFMARQNPELEIEMVDISALALESCRKTLAKNGVTGKVYPSDVYSDISGRFDHIVSNPPFHAGLKTDYHAAETFIAEAPRHLQGAGLLTLVANAFLRYPPILEAHFAKTVTLAEDNKFRVYQSSHSHR